MTGASKPGTLAYNSWLTMQAAGGGDPDTCAYNDLALIRLDPTDVGKVNPSVPGYGGPTGVGHGFPELHLVPGTQPFSASLVGAILGA